MALPVQFAALTDATGAQLDQNFAALGALTPIPCAASGGNAQVLVPNADTPTITAYSNYMQFTAIAAQSNTGASTGKVGSLAQLPIYKPSPAGPIPLTGGEIVALIQFVLLYDSALNGGAGGFHLMNVGVITAAGGSVSGPIVGVGSLATLTYPQAAISLASISRLVVGAGNPITRVNQTLASLTFSALLPQSGTVSDILLPGASINDIVSFGLPPGVTVGMSYKGFVPNAGTVTMQVFNGTGSTIAPIAGAYRVQAIGYT